MIYLMILFSIIIIQILPDIKLHIHFFLKTIVISKKNFVETLFVMEMMGITVLRKYTVGADLPMYVGLFERIHKYSWRNLLDSKFELGYMLFTRLIRYFSDNAQVFIIVTGIVTVGFYLYEIHHKSYNSFLIFYLSLTYGFFFFQYSMIRQVIAMTFFMIAIDKLSEKKWMDYVLIILLASTFHTSVIVCLPLVLIVLFPWTNYVLNLMWVIEIVVLVSLRGILEIVVPHISRYSYILNETTSYKLGYIVRIIIICGLYLASVFFCKIGIQGDKVVIKKDSDKKDNFLLIIGSIGMMLMPMINYFESVQRMTYYFTPYIFWCVDLAAERSKWMNRMLIFLYILLGIYYILCFTGFTSVNNMFGTNDYLFFWQ